jgi:hypothetical protein
MGVRANPDISMDLIRVVVAKYVPDSKYGGRELLSLQIIGQERTLSMNLL